MDEHKFEKICFCCLTEEGQLKNMMDEIFVTTKVKVQFVEGYTVCSGIVPDDESTKNICLACEDKLKSSYEFRELCRSSYQILKERTEMIAELYVNVKHEMSSEDEFVYSSSKREGKKSRPNNQFSQVYVKDTFDTRSSPLKKPKKSSPVKASVPEPPSPKIDTEQKPQLPVEPAVKDEESDQNDFPNAEESDNEVRVTRKRRLRQKKAKPELKKVKRMRPNEIKIVPFGVDAADLDSNFFCYHCETYLHSHKAFLKHREQHMVGNGYQKLHRICQICNTDAKYYFKHIEEFHKDYKPNTCNYCEKGRFQTSTELKSHLYTHAKCKPSHKCLACNEKFKSEVLLRGHVSSHRNPNNQYLCPFCGQEFSQMVKCQEHFISTHGGSKALYPCYHCKRIYMVSKWYEEHECMKHSKTTEPGCSSTLATCNGCTAVFTCQDELDCHNTRGCLLDSEANKCPECGKEFDNRNKLKRHMKLHDPSKRIYVCDECGHSSMSEGLLRMHKFMHLSDRPFKCALCPASFKRAQHLSGHQKVHKEKPFECFLCERKFRTYDYVRSHMAVHTDSTVLRRFVCQLCGKTAVSGTALGRHMKSHTHEKDFKCDLCPKAFRDISAVNKHYRKTHEGWFYECKFCLKPYKDAVKFRNHLFVHRGFKPYNCPVCPSGHVEKYLFVKHLRNHNINFNEKLHGYREAENIKELIEECLTNENNKKQTVSTASASGVRIVETAVRDAAEAEQPNPEYYEATAPQLTDNNVPVNMLMQKHFFPSHYNI